jgi:hypothetical protein
VKGISELLFLSRYRVDHTYWHALICLSRLTYYPCRFYAVLGLPEWISDRFHQCQQSKASAQGGRRSRRLQRELSINGLIPTATYLLLGEHNGNVPSRHLHPIQAMRRTLTQRRPQFLARDRDQGRPTKARASSAKRRAKALQKTIRRHIIGTLRFHDNFGRQNGSGCA